MAGASKPARVEGVAYVICPIGPQESDIRTRSNEILEYIIEPAVTESGLKVDRADKDQSPGNITAKIIQSILDARVVIADLTGHNPNVFYELGVAHSFGVRVVMLNDSTQNQPFDVHNERAIELGSTGRISLRDAARVRLQLKAALRAVLAEAYEPASVVSDVANKRQLAELESSDPYASQVEAISSQLDSILSRLRTLEQNDLSSLYPKMTSGVIAAGMPTVGTTHVHTGEGLDLWNRLSTKGDLLAGSGLSSGPVIGGFGIGDLVVRGPVSSQSISSKPKVKVRSKPRPGKS